MLVSVSVPLSVSISLSFSLSLSLGAGPVVRLLGGGSAAMALYWAVEDEVEGQV